jgi:hypothetical protein
MSMLAPITPARRSGGAPVLTPLAARRRRYREVEAMMDRLDRIPDSDRDGVRPKGWRNLVVNRCIWFCEEHGTTYADLLPRALPAREQALLTRLCIELHRNSPIDLKTIGILFKRSHSAIAHRITKSEQRAAASGVAHESKKGNDDGLVSAAECVPANRLHGSGLHRAQGSGRHRQIDHDPRRRRRHAG